MMNHYSNLLITVFKDAGIQTAKVFLAVLLIGIAAYYLEILGGRILARLFGVGSAIAVMKYLTLPGVIHHEFSHALLATITGAKVTEINLIPRGNTLGYVNFVPRGPKFFQALQCSLSAIAPPLLGFVTLYCMLEYVSKYISGGWAFLYFYILFSIAIHMTLSPPDIRNFFRGIIPTVLVVFIVCCGIQIYGLI